VNEIDTSQFDQACTGMHIDGILSTMKEKQSYPMGFDLYIMARCRSPPPNNISSHGEVYYPIKNVFFKIEHCDTLGQTGIQTSADKIKCPHLHT
jgi:hypothetical protein